MEEKEDFDFVSCALGHFRHPERAKRLNCAQSVLKAFQGFLNVSDSLVDSYSEYGYGRSPGGYCGALFAGKYLLEEHFGVGGLEERFTEAAGSTLCKEIRKGRKLSCAQCVEEATKFVAEKAEERLRR